MINSSGPQLTLKLERGSTWNLNSCLLLQICNEQSHKNPTSSCSWTRRFHQLRVRLKHTKLVLISLIFSSNSLTLLFRGHCTICWLEFSIEFLWRMIPITSILRFLSSTFRVIDPSSVSKIN